MEQADSAEMTTGTMDRMIAEDNGNGGNETAALEIDRSLVLVGLMGAGKSCIGRKLAQKLGLPFVDADNEIEKAAGCSIADIFETRGEEEFREGERRVIARLLDGPPIVLATGGGAFMDPHTREKVKECGISIWLRADLDLLVRRTAKRNHRPLLNKGNPRQILRNLIQKRYPTYNEAEIVVDSQNGPPEETVKLALEGLKSYLERHGDSARTGHKDARFEVGS
ncbi:shikimate kinase [Limibacillus halophilus]|uniref:Shikimate kinase n=2 Tax=Limibacillus halophilus TaxID=1579333 RepID=A0A839SU38_9PROT|nr:shikimate kinase [Limibacillus halophilus]MBB3066347.1 shikimate kinase [Limibacillus halophilus]